MPREGNGVRALYPMKETESLGETNSSSDSDIERVQDGHPWPKWRARWPLSLLVIVVGFGVAYFGLSFLRYLELYGTNWDLGVNMQAAWTTTHGYLMYESGDYESVRALSFLFIHPAYVLFPVAGIYFFAPYAATLFAIQGLALASSAIPLYRIGIRAGVRPTLLFAGLVVYLASLPVLSGFLYDFHWEAFLPMEFLWTYYLWERSRYWAAAIPAVVGSLTLEVFPVLIVALVAYFGWPHLRALLGKGSPRWSRFGATLRGPARPLIGLLALGVAGFVGPVMFSVYLLPKILGSGPIFESSGSGSYFGFLYVSFSSQLVGIRVLYWLTLLGSFGFLPLLNRQRLLILTLPWFLYTVAVTPNQAFTTLGYQYSLVAIGPLAIGFVEGLAIFAVTPQSRANPWLTPWTWLVLELPFVVLSFLDPSVLVRPTVDNCWIGLSVGSWALVGSGVWWLFWARRRRTAAPGRFQSHRGTYRFLKPGRAALIGAVAILVSANVMLSPLNTSNFRGPGSAAYSFTYAPNPVYGPLVSLADKIPTTATVVASDNLFPFVANNRHAYSLFWYPMTPPYWPFNATNLPGYVLLSTDQWFVPSYIESALYNSRDYGLAATLYYAAGYPGSVFLFELHYTGSVSVVEVDPFSPVMTLCPNALALGPSGVVRNAPGTLCGSTVQSQPASNLSGNNATIWYGPYATLLPGNYTVTISLRGNLSAPAPLSSPVVVMDANALGTPLWYSVAISANQLSPTNWTTFTYHFALTEPHPQAEWRGYIAGPHVGGVSEPGDIARQFIQVVDTSLAP